MKRARTLYAVGVTLAATGGFVSPFRWTGFIVLGAGAIWAAYDLTDIGEADRGDASTTTPYR